MWGAIKTKLDSWKKNWARNDGRLTPAGCQQVYLFDWLGDQELGRFLTAKARKRQREQLDLKLLGNAYSAGNKHEVTLRLDLEIPPEWMEDAEVESTDSSEYDETDLSHITFNPDLMYKKTQFELYKKDLLLNE